MKIKLTFLLLYLATMLSGCWSLAKLCKPEDTGYLFTSFRGNGEDGLHLAYSYDGYNWTDLGGPFLVPQVGENKLMRDPSLAQGPDGIFHLVWTTDWRNNKGIGYAWSADMINFSKQRIVLTMDHEPDTYNVWAPEIYYNEKDKLFVICWASTIKGRYSDEPKKLKNDHRMYYTTTKDFKTFTEAKLLLESGFGVIDAVIVDYKDRYVLVLKDEARTQSLRVAFGDSYLGPFTNISDTFTEQFTEGPCTLKLGDEWVIYFDMHMKKRYGAVRTSDFKTFENINDEISFPQGHRHGTATQVPRKVIDTLKKYRKENPEEKNK